MILKGFAFDGREGLISRTVEKLYSDTGAVGNRISLTHRVTLTAGGLFTRYLIRNLRYPEGIYQQRNAGMLLINSSSGMQHSLDRVRAR